MAFFKYAQVLRQDVNPEFDKLFEPGQRTSWSGIYRCEGCGREIVHTHHHPLPPQNHHQHSYSQGRIRWRLIVTDAA